MAKKKREDKGEMPLNTHISNAGVMVEQGITDVLEKNYMPYAMSVIMSRALPQIDGFKPSHRKILYTMFKMGLLGGGKTKSANIVGQTMRLNPHGDSAIYETMVRLSRGYNALLHYYVESKGNFGKSFSRDMAYAASRYTEAKLSKICKEIFGDIDKNTVDFVPNYDNTTTEPVILPVTFPSILVNLNLGIAVSMASSICSFNLEEVCRTTINLMYDKNFNIFETLKGPDFASGGFIINNEVELDKIYKTGRGSVKIRSRYNYDKSYNCIDIVEIPPTTTIEAIIDKVVDLVKQGKIKEISDIRDETGLSGLKITIDLKRGINPEKLMKKLYKYTTLEDNFSCNFNLLVDNMPMVLGVEDILNYWIKFRISCVKRRVKYTLDKYTSQLHLLKGLNKILLNIDKAIKIIRETEKDSEVESNLMESFDIDSIQVGFICDIKLRNLNKEYILNKTKDIKKLEEYITDLTDTLKKEERIRSIIKEELESVIENHGLARKSLFIYLEESDIFDEKQSIEDYKVNIFLTKEGYFKKILPQSIRGNNEHKLKPGDEIIDKKEVLNSSDILIFGSSCNLYKFKLIDIQEVKASMIGEYIKAKLGISEDEDLLKMIVTINYTEKVIFVYENGKIAKLTLEVYKTKLNRKKITKAFIDKYKIVGIYFIVEDKDFYFETSSGKRGYFNSGLIETKDFKGYTGVSFISLEKGSIIVDFKEAEYKDKDIKIVKSIPIAEKKLKDGNYKMNI